MDFLKDPTNMIIGVGVVIILLTVGRKPHLKLMHGNAGAKWTAFSVSTFCGLVLGFALKGVVSWLTSLKGAGALPGSIGAIAALTLGWWAIYMLVGMIRDLADKEPDKEAQQAALWVPTLIQGGWGAVTGLISSPMGIGRGLTAAIMAAITLVACFKINGAALKTKNHRAQWNWFAAAVSVLAGLVGIALLAYIDDVLADYLSGKVMFGVRILGGTLGIAFGIAALVDWFQKDPQTKKRTPDEHVRRFGYAGIPLLYLLGSASIAWLFSSANSGLDGVTGVVS